MSIECEGFTFISNFDSSNIDRVELVPKSENDESPENEELPNYEFNIWTRADCAGTEFANNNRSWFYFGVKSGIPCTDVKLNVVNLNKQGKLYNQGMAPVYRTTPGPNHWERVRDRLSFDLKKNLLSFGYRTLENLCSTTYFAFTYPYSFVDLQNSFKQFDLHLKKLNISSNPLAAQPDDIYYHRECLIQSLEGRPIDLITISSHHGITTVQEPRLKGLFPDINTPRSYQFKGKKVIFLSARVHPGETPSSFVMNGVLNLLLSKSDLTAILLRKMFVFKLIPMLNPDGVSRGCYRTDTRGANLNRFYLNPSRVFHPSIFAAKALILFYHYGHEKKEDPVERCVGDSVGGPPRESKTAASAGVVSVPPPSNPQIEVTGSEAVVGVQPLPESTELLSDAASAWSLVSVTESTSNEEAEAKIISDTENLNDKVAEISMVEEAGDGCSPAADLESQPEDGLRNDKCSMCGVLPSPASLPKLSPAGAAETSGRKKLYKMRRLSRSKLEDSKRPLDSGLYLYIDFHGHASKKGIFMYGNHFDNISDKVECLLLPKLLSINNPHFHYNQCNFSKRNMYTRDRRDGLSKEGCGRVAVLKYTGLIKSYTLECNYNTGCIVNIIPPAQRPLGKAIVQPVLVPPKYTPQIYEEVGRALCVSILDMTGCNPNSRLPLSQFKSVSGLRESLRGEAIVAKNLQVQQNLKVRQGIALLQRGNKTVNKNFANKRKLLSLKRQSKTNLFSELPPSAQTTEKKDAATVPLLPAKSGRPNSTSAILHPLNKCGLSSGAIGLLKKQSKTKLPSEMQKNRRLLKKKMFGLKLEKDVCQGKAEFSGWISNKRKIEKKLSPTGNASTSARPPNKKRKKSKIM